MWHYPLPLFDNVWFDGHLTRTQGQPCLHILFTPHVLFPSLLYSLRVTHSMLLTKRYSLNVLFLIKNINPKMFLTCWIKQNLSVRNLVLDKIFLFTCYLNLFKFREREREECRTQQQQQQERDWNWCASCFFNYFLLFNTFGCNWESFSCS